MTTENDFKKYHEWLLTRSWTGILYRKFYLYPQINKRINGQVLDIGCGIGDYVRMSNNAIGLDINPFNIEYCKSIGLNCVLFENNIPFNDETFDSILFDNVIEHIYDPYNLINDAKRVLKTGGRMIIGIPGIEHFFYDSDHKVCYSEDQLNNNFYIDGLKTIEIFYTPKIKILRKFFVHSCRWLVLEKC